MDFQISKVILWPKDGSRSPVVVSFERGTINVISGVSRTGKSAIIPIIDYCLGSRRCTIPTGIIREKTSWFGVLVTTPEGEKLFARREPEQQQATDDMFIKEDRVVPIPNSIVKNATRDAIKKRLDQFSMLTTLSFSADDPEGGLGRPSFRDLAAFNFQPQNIVANPNVLFYKADTVEHRAKLRSIFPYVLGALSAETLALRHELHRLQRELRRKEADLRNIQTLAERWSATIDARLAEARDLGLVTSPLPENVTQSASLEILRDIAATKALEQDVNSSTIDEGITELRRLNAEERKIAQSLSVFRRRASEMEQLKENAGLYHDSLVVQRDRLQLSRWLGEQSTEKECPLCRSHLTEQPVELSNLISALDSLEQTAAGATIPPSFDREVQRVKAAISEHVEHLRGIRIRQEALTKASQAARDRQYSEQRALRFVGHLEADLQVLDTVGTDGELSEEVAQLQERVKSLERVVSEAEIGSRTRRALSSVNLFAGRLMPFLDAESPNDPVSLSETELTIKVQRVGREDFLWEIGSGSNWLSYHVATTLALHQYFLQLPNCPVPNFIVYDQPSQVYFPKRLADRDDSLISEDPPWRDQDEEAVRKIFAAMSAAMAASSRKFQVIVLDHAARPVWGGVPLVHEVADWRDGRALIPQEWM